MIRSMTGFGSASAATDALRASVTVRSLNHRFLDVTLHLSRQLLSLESEIKALVQQTLQRGRVEVAVQASFADGARDAVVPSRALVASLVRALRDMQNEFGLEGGVAVSDLVRFPGALERVEPPAEVAGEERRQLLELVERALKGLGEMRRAEGERLAEGLRRGLDAVEAAAARIESLSEAAREARRASLLGRLRVLVAELGLEEARLYQEVVRAVERQDVTEELQRLRSHVAMARELLGADAPAGKRLDFLAQELMREANTAGSKAADAPLAQEVVALKSEIERLREQVQNVE